MKIVAENEKLQSVVKNDLNDLNSKTEKLKESIEEKIFKKLKKDNEIMMKMFEEDQRKVITKALEEKSMQGRKDIVDNQNCSDKAEVGQNKDKPKHK